MSLFILFLGAAYGLGLIVTIRGVATAPQGSECAQGFVAAPTSTARTAKAVSELGHLEGELSRAS